MISIALIGGVSARPSQAAEPKAPTLIELLSLIETLRPIHTKLGEPAEGDWLDEYDEPRQTFRDYLEEGSTTATKQRRVIYVQPLGEFDKAQRAIITATADFLKRYYQLPVTVESAWPSSRVPASARRRYGASLEEQLSTEYVIEEMLIPALPPDAAGLIALTPIDLWPGDDWNYVFGEASVDDRVGVWSIARYGDPSAGSKAFHRCLLRTIQTASHEVGHLFGMGHCTLYQCNMGGSNSLKESDAGSLPLCPECVAKLCWATKCDPTWRFEQLLDFCGKHGLTEDKKFYEQSLHRLKSGAKSR